MYFRVRATRMLFNHCHHLPLHLSFINEGGGAYSQRKLLIHLANHLFSLGDNTLFYMDLFLVLR